MTEPEAWECPTCGARAGERCRRLIQDPRTHAVRRREPGDAPARPGRWNAAFPHGARVDLARFR